MIPILLYLLYALALVYLAGFAAWAGIRRVARSGAVAGEPGAVACCLLGMVLLTTVASVVSLLAPVDERLHVAVAAGTAAYAAFARKPLWVAMKRAIAALRDTPAWLTGLAGVVVLLACARSSGLVYWRDTGLYHAQAVRWIREYGAVPGLGNLHDRIAFNNSWFVLAAFFDVFGFAGRSARIINLIPWCIAAALVARGASGICRGEMTAANLLRVSVALLMLFSREAIASLSPDFASTLLVYWAVIELVEVASAARTGIRPAPDWFLGITAVAAFAMTVKLSAALAVLLPALPAWWFFRRDHGRLLAGGALLACGVIAPFIARNVVLSGYLIFPLARLDLFTVDWKVPRAGADQCLQFIKVYPLVYSRSCMSLLGLSAAGRVAFWARTNLLHPQWQSVAAPGGPLLCGGLAVRAFRRRSAYLGRLAALCGLATAGTAMWLVSAPDPRFALAWLAAGVLVPLAAVLARRLGRARRLPRWAAICLSAGPMALLVVSGLLPLRHGGTCLLRVRPLPASRLERRVVDGITLYAPLPSERDNTWNAPLPATPYADAGLHARGRSLADGFRRSAPQEADWFRSW